MSLLNTFKSKKEKNINLLVEAETKPTLVKRRVFLVFLIPLGVFIFMLLAFMLIFALEKQQSMRSADIAKKMSQQEAEWRKYSQTATAIKSIKSSVSEYKKQSVINKNVLSSIKSIQEIVPDSVLIKKLDVQDSSEVAIEGAAKNPKAVFQLFNILKSKTTKFSDVKLLNIGYSSDSSGEGGATEEDTFNFSINLKVITNEK